MISRGYFKISEQILSRLLRENGLEHVKKFIWEMFVCGGRISKDELEYWMDFLEKEMR